MGFFKNIGAGIQGFGQGYKSRMEEGRATGEQFTDYRGTFDAKGARVPGTDRPNLMQLIQGGMTDDQGLFQGGKDNRMFGRYRDYADEVNARGGNFTLPGGKVPVGDESTSQTRSHSPFTYRPPIYDDGSGGVTNGEPNGEPTGLLPSAPDYNQIALDYGSTFDVENPENVGQLQQHLMDANITDWEGNPFSLDKNSPNYIDNMYGPRTESAMDFLRTGEYKPAEYYQGQYSGNNDADAYGFGTNNGNGTEPTQGNDLSNKEAPTGLITGEWENDSNITDGQGNYWNPHTNQWQVGKAEQNNFSSNGSVPVHGVQVDENMQW